MNYSKQLVDGALFTVCYIVLLLVTIFVPVLGLISMLVLAVPFIIYAAKYDWKPSLLMFVAAFLLSILIATIYAAPAAVLAGLGGIVIGSSIHRELAPYETWARGTIGYAVGIVFSLLFIFYILDINLLDEFSQQTDELLIQMKDMVEQFGMGQEVEEEFSIIEQQIELFKQSVPVFIVVIAILLAILNQWISYKVINKIDKQKLRFPKFRNLRFPVSILWIYLLAMIITLFQEEPNGLYIALQNVIMLTGLLMAIQGLSFIFFISHRKNISIAIPIVVMVLTIFFAPFLLPLVRILGIIDLGFGLRDRMVK